MKRNTPVKRIDMTNSMIEKGWYSHRNMRTLLGKGMESTFDFEATLIPQLKTKQRKLGKDETNTVERAKVGSCGC